MRGYAMGRARWPVDFALLPAFPYVRLQARGIRATFDLLETFPKLLGQPGKPGYRVVAIASLNATAIQSRLAPQYVEKGVALLAEVSSGLPTIQADPDRILQVVRALCGGRERA